MSNHKYSIMAIDDHPIIHDGIKILLAAEPDLEISETASSAKEAMRKLRRKRPDLVIADMSMDDSDGTQLIRKIHTTFPRLKILVYSMTEERLFAERAASAGASGYVMKTSSPDELRSAIRRVLDGKRCFPADVLESIEANEKSKCSSVLGTLSQRQMDIFKLLGEGLNSTQIAERLGISRNTVDTHRINIKNKLNLPNGKALERMAYETITKQPMKPKKKRQTGR